ncbi:MAG: hypothetical protein JWM57_1746 [Phycisphaerales bacterium]|nr:hypothetical protein [Phycisphaerales bacterium]
MRRGTRLSAALAAVCLTTLIAPAVHAATIFSDSFNDADRNNDGITDDGTSTAVTSPDGVPFYLGRGTSSATVSVVNDAAGLGGGFAAQNISATTTTRPLVANFSNTTLSAGDSISISFDYRLTGAIPDFDRPFRFGLYNAGAAVVTGDTTASATTDDDIGYYVSQDTGNGGTSTNVLSLLGDPATTLLGGTSVGLGATTTNTAYGLTTTDKHHAVFTITRSNDDLVVTLALDNLAVLTGNAVNGNATTSPLTYSFNEFAIGENGAALGYLLDNVTATYTAAATPEPASLSLLAVVGLLAGRRRRSPKH